MSPAGDGPLGVYLDDCIDARNVAVALGAAGFQVVSPAEVGLLGARDHEHLSYAAHAGLVLLTRNPEDFQRLHSQSSAHAGILLVYQDNDVTRDMRPTDIAHALRNLLESGLPIVGCVHVLNHWRY